MECARKVFDDREFSIVLERRRRAKENGMKRKIIRMMDEAKTEKLFAELSEEMERSRSNIRAI